MSSNAQRAAAQDIEVAAARRGIRLPAAYYERLRQNPDVFEFPRPLYRVTPFGAQPTHPANPLAAPGAPSLVEGTARIPIILMLFEDSDNPAITPAHVQASLFDGPAPSGTITAFYEEMSRGRFHLLGDVAPWVRTSVTKLLADGDTYGLGSTSSLGIALIEALQKVDATVDFSRYDSNRDGFVDAVGFEYLEIAASCGNRGIWPHRSGIGNWNGGSPFTTNDIGVGGQPVKVDGYIIQSVADCSGKTVQTAGTMAHEYGHVLGFPDFYHAIGGVEPENRRWVLGCWELMAAGSWGCGPITDFRANFGPTHMLAQQKSVMGWVDLQNVGEVWDSLFVLDPIQTSGRALRVPMDSTGAEALIIEYRPRTGFDVQIPAAGILISKLDSRGSLRPTGGSIRYSNMLLEADGNGGLVRNHAQGGNRGEPGDAFAVGGETSKLSFMSPVPLIRNLTGQASWVTIHSMQVVDGRARIRISSSRTPKVNSPTATSTGRIATRFVQSARVMGGYMPYGVSGVEAAPAGLTASAVEDDVLLNGVPMAAGAFSVLIHLTDARGSRFDLRMPVTIAPYVADQAQLLAPFLHTVATPLAVEERTYLDSSGNQNGTFDVGDLRAWLTKPQS